MMAALWLPVVVSIVMATVLPNAAFPVERMLERMSVVTVAMVGLQSAGIRGLKILPAVLIFVLGMASSSLTGIWDMPVVPLVCAFTAIATFFVDVANSS